MSRFPSRRVILSVGLSLMVPVSGFSNVIAMIRNGVTAKVDLVESRVKATIGPEWIDVEEDAVLQVIPVQEDQFQIYQLNGEITLPPQAQVTGCLFWKGDTVLKGKLRVHANAVQDFNNIVNDTTSFSSDPMLLEKKSESVYGIRAYPFIPRGARHMRIRYLVPVVARDGSVPVLPIFAQVSGAKPVSWTLQTRGKVDGLKLHSDKNVWALASPAVQAMSFPATGTVSLVWGSNASVGAPRAIFDRISSGPWAGDYVLFTAKIPDSLARRVEIRSETVILWRWIHPESFVKPCDTETCLTDDGILAVNQAKAIARTADWIAGEGNKVAMISNLVLDDPSVTHPMGDSASDAFLNLKTWINSVDEENVKLRVANLVGTPGFELERNRSRFASDLNLAASLFSKDTGIVKHILVVTVGANPVGGESLQNAVDTGLPSTVSVASTRFEGDDSVWNAVDSTYVRRGFAPATWPGVNLPLLEKKRIGTYIVWTNNIRIPRTRNFASATISIAKASDTLAVYPSISKGADGNWLASLNVHDVGLGRTLKWRVDDQGVNLATWETTPTWINLVDDSIVPRLWAVSPLHTSLLTGFGPSLILGNVFGYVDEKYSLLALPADSLSRAESRALADSGMPFLTNAEIFSDKYKDPSGPPVTRSLKMQRTKFDAVVMGLGMVRITFGGESPRLLQILDVEGRVIVQWTAPELVGKLQLDWTSRDRKSLRKGLILVRMVTATGVHSVPLALP